MKPTGARIAALAAVTGVLLLALAGAGRWIGSSAQRRPSPPVDAAARRGHLADLAVRLVPSASGGWVVESPGEPSVESWLLAAVSTRSPAAFDRALAHAELALADTPDPRALLLVIAQVLPGPGPGSGDARATRLGGVVVERAVAALDAGDGTWLAPLLQLSAGGSSAAAAARAELVRRVGPVACDRLPAALPPPSTSLTLVIRVLAIEERRCPAAAGLLDRAVEDPAWDTWIASPELADLVAVGGPLPTAVRARLERRLARFVAVVADRPIDLGGVVAVQAARDRLGLPAALPVELERHLDGQIRHRGALPGRSTAPPTPLDVAVLRQLVGQRGISAADVRATEAASTWPEVAGPVDPIADQLLVGRRALPCTGVPEAGPEPVRVTFEQLVVDQTWSTLRAGCADDLDVAGMIRELGDEPDPVQRVVRTAVTELAACRLDPSSLDDVRGRRLTVDGAFAADTIVRWAQAVVADPRAACAAVRRT